MFISLFNLGIIQTYLAFRHKKVVSAFFFLKTGENTCNVLNILIKTKAETGFRFGFRF
jgi:hypothetical protein